MIKKSFDELKLTGRLPSPPGVGMSILKLTQGENVSAEDIGHAILADPSLTGHLLKIANSAQAAGFEPIATVPDAIMRLGVRAVRNIALGLSLVTTYRTGLCERFDYDRYWTRSLARAVAAQALSRQMRKAVPAEVYILGLLSEIGRLALATVYPAKYSELLAHTGDSPPQVVMRAERERFDIDHSEVGAYMLDDWGLPASHSEAVHQCFLREESDPADPQVSSIARILRRAHLLAEIMLTVEDHAPDRWVRFAAELEKLRGELDLEPPAFREFYRNIVRELREWGATLRIPSDAVVDFSEVELRAARATGTDSSETGGASAPVDGAGADASAGGTPAERTSTPATAVTGSKLASGQLRILAIDDDPMSLKLLERHLKSVGHEVLCANDGEEGLQKALDFNPQVLITDWMMPNMDGIELCKALRRIECGREMYILILTGKNEEDRAVEAFAAGVDDYVTKPFNPRILMARIKGGQRVIELKKKVEEDKRLLLEQAGELGLLNRKLRTAALTDVLTDLPNRRYAMKRLEQEWETSRRTGRPLSVIMVDIDHFKKVNDEYGHDIGDAVLKQTANVLKTKSRQGEDPARLGGEEFIVICSNTTAAQAAICAERMRASVEANHVVSGNYAGHVTVSLGVAQGTPEMSGVDALFKASDEAVYAAKHAGRNRVSMAAVNAQALKSA